MKSIVLFSILCTSIFFSSAISQTTEFEVEDGLLSQKPFLSAKDKRRLLALPWYIFLAITIGINIAQLNASIKSTKEISFQPYSKTLPANTNNCTYTKKYVNNCDKISNCSYYCDQAPVAKSDPCYIQKECGGIELQPTGFDAATSLVVSSIALVGARIYDNLFAKLW